MFVKQGDDGEILKVMEIKDGKLHDVKDKKTSKKSKTSDKYEETVKIKN
jgi:hypothetical protein